MTSVTGKGIFSWDGTERRTDRYGSFTLDSSGYDGNGSYPDAAWSWDVSLSSLNGKRVKIIAEVMETRDSGHIGDLSRGIYPSRPEIGEIIELGVGEFFMEKCDWSASDYTVGIKPFDGRMHDWFDPKKLYRLHDQTVFITITETDEESDFTPHSEAEQDFSIITFPENNGMCAFQYKGKNFEIWK